MNPTSQLPFDLEAEQEAINHKKLLAQTLSQQAMTPQQGQMVSGHYVTPGLMGALAPILQAFLSQQVAGKAKTDQTKLTETLAGKTQGGLESYFKTRDGTPAGVMSDQQVRDLMNNDQDPGELLGTKPDPRRAAIQALTSGIPILQQLGQSDLSSLGKSTLTAKDILALGGKDKYDTKSALAAALSGDITKLQPAIQEHVVNNQIITGQPGSYGVNFDARDKFDNVSPVGTDNRGNNLLGQRELTTGKVNYAPQGTTVNVDTAQKAGEKFASELAGKRAEVIAKSYDNATIAVKGIEALQNAEEDLSRGIKSGAGADVALGLAKWGKALGMEADPTITNTEAFRADMARETMQLVKNLGSGTGISNTDLKFAEDASGGKITLDDTSMLRLLNIGKASAGNILAAHDRLLRSNRGATGALPADLASFEVPFSMNGSDQLRFDERQQKFVTGSPQQPHQRAAQAASPSPAKRRVIKFEDY